MDEGRIFLNMYRDHCSCIRKHLISIQDHFTLNIRRNTRKSFHRLYGFITIQWLQCLTRRVALQAPLKAAWFCIHLPEWSIISCDSYYGNNSYELKDLRRHGLEEGMIQIWKCPRYHHGRLAPRTTQDLYQITAHDLEVLVIRLHPARTLINLLSEE